MKAIIKIDVPDFQIGQEVNIHFRDSMVAKGVVALSQEPCGDAISRQDVVKAVDKHTNDDGTLDDDITCILEDVPSVTPQQKVGRWITVSERLPEINQRVLVTSYGRVCYAMMISADGNSGYPIFRLQDSLNERVICETTVHSEFTRSRITAWMPLPQPMKVGEENC